MHLCYTVLVHCHFTQTLHKSPQICAILYCCSSLPAAFNLDTKPWQDKVMALLKVQNEGDLKRGKIELSWLTIGITLERKAQALDVGSCNTDGSSWSSNNISEAYNDLSVLLFHTVAHLQKHHNCLWQKLFEVMNFIICLVCSISSMWLSMMVPSRNTILEVMLTWVLWLGLRDRSVLYNLADKYAEDVGSMLPMVGPRVSNRQCRNSIFFKQITTPATPGTRG